MPRTELPRRSTESSSEREPLQERKNPLKLYGEEREPLRLRGGAGDYEIYSPGGTAYTIEGKHGGNTEFVNSAANRNRPPEHTLIKKDITNLKQGTRKSAKEWTLEKPDDSTRIQLQHTDGRVINVPPTYSGRRRFYGTIGMKKYNYWNLKNEVCQEAKGWQIHKPEQGQSSSGRGEASREGSPEDALVRQLDAQLARDRQELEARQAGLAQELWPSWNTRTRDDGRSGLP